MWKVLSVETIGCPLYSKVEGYDDVELGKTIEAGIILQELSSRNLANKVLIFVPAALQIQWKDEMKDKFGMEFTIFDSDNEDDNIRER